MPGLPRGRVLKSYGKDSSNDTASLLGSTFRNFKVSVGEDVEIVDMEDDMWWKVRLVSEDAAACPKPANTSWKEIAQSKLNSGWVPAAHICLLTRRRPGSTVMSVGHADWDGMLAEVGPDGLGLPREDTAGIKAGQKCRALVGEDVEIAKLIAYKQIIAARAADHAQKTDMMPWEWLFDHWCTHAGFAALIIGHVCLAHADSPTIARTMAGFAIGFVSIDLLSTVYHLLLDYGVLSSYPSTVTDLHHKLPMNYNLFSQRQLLATSYVAVLPMHLIHVVVYAALRLFYTAMPFYTAYMASWCERGATALSPPPYSCSKAF